MTDPNVIEAMNLLSAAVCSLATKGLSHKPSDAQHAIDLADEASELLAAAEKPAAKPTADCCEGLREANIAIGLLSKRALEAEAKLAAAQPAATGAPCESWYVAEGVRCQLSAGHQSPHRYEGSTPGYVMTWPAEKPAEAAPVAPALPWVVRRNDGEVVAQFRYWHDAVDFAGDSGQREVAAAPTVAAVEFNKSGDACGDGWVAESFALESPCRVSVSIDLRPGEDAGETVAKMLAACGRGL